MREILFRGKHTVDGKWVYGNLLKIRGRPHINSVNFYGQVVSDSVGQMSGLFDKNARPIYEGDIIEFEDTVSCTMYDDVYDTKNRAVVGFEKGAFTLIKFWLDADSEVKEYVFGGECHSRENLLYLIENSAVIIGNIYENPELLEVTS